MTSTTGPQLDIRFTCLDCFSLTTSRSQKMILKADWKCECPYFYSKFFLKSFGQYEMDGQTSVIEMDRGTVYEMDKHTKCQNMEIPLKSINFFKDFFTGTRMC